MKASERLRELANTAWGVDVSVTRNELRLIADVVEAAERLLPFLEEYALDADEQGFQTAASQMHKVHTHTAAALTALTAALEGDTPR